MKHDYLSFLQKILSLLTLTLFLSTTSAFTQTRNPTPSSYNPYATYTNGHREYLRMGTGYRNEILRDTPMYDGAGRQIGTARAGILGDVDDKTRGGYNAGAMIDIEINGVPEKAVLCWNIYKTNPFGRGTGFVLTKDLKYRSTIESRMETCKSNLKNVRPNDFGEPETHYIIKDQTSPWPENVYIYPNQTTVQNKVKYYYINKGVINLLVDLPYTPNVGGEIKGKAIDIASPGRSFRRIQKIQSVARDVFEQGSENVIGEVRFVYGYVYTNTNERIYCWVNLECLEKPATLNIHDTEEAISKIFPNPTSHGEVFIETDNIQAHSIQMYDILGRKQKAEYFSINGGLKIKSNYKGIGIIQYLDLNNKPVNQKVIWK